MRLICTFVLAFTCNFTFAQVGEQHYLIYSKKEAKVVSLNSVVDAMADYDVLFFGEEHNDSVGHYLESQLFEMLYKKYNSKLTLSLEMFDRDVQPVMNEYLQGGIREKHFVKDARTWKNYKDYRPMVEFAKKQHLDVICANAASRYSNLAGREGQSALQKLPAESKNNFAPVPYDTATGKYYEKLTGFSEHGTSKGSDTTKKQAVPMLMMGNFNLNTAQSLWDATMAYSIAGYLKKHKGQKVFQVNGRFHSDEGFAAVSQLKKYSPKTRSLVVSVGSDDAFTNPDWTKYGEGNDFVILTDPSVPKTFKSEF